MTDNEVEIQACPFCLSADLNYFQSAPGVSRKSRIVSPVSLCGNCGRAVMPIVFKSLAEYEKARRELGK